ncbi:MAG TPA: hypothetical protein VME69_09085 [Methylocella sp.]|nr:hypothetical protein [Methylocella sp.]
MRLISIGIRVKASCLAAFALFAGVLQAGCNLSSGGQTPVATATPQAPARPDWPKLPDGAPCTDALTHYQTILDSDVSTGNVNRSVYDQIEVELVPAASACAAGKSSEALNMIRKTKEKHGYHA